MSRNTISRWERGEFSPSADKMAELKRMLVQLEAPAVPEDTPAPEDTPVPKAAEPPSVAPAKARRWPVALLCAGVVCALLMGIMALIGVYSIKQQLEPTDSVAPIIEEAEIERKEMDQSLMIESATLQPLQPQGLPEGR